MFLLSWDIPPVEGQARLYPGPTAKSKRCLQRPGQKCTRRARPTTRKVATRKSPGSAAGALP
eukprot:6052026-Pyramimonas_sp.AAC.1